jgi:UDP-hydrolysing UDP-N-acetyl-D-glucosamine 2-epimerase
MVSVPLLEVVVSARPSWARVKSLVEQYKLIAGNDKIKITLIGPAVSERYGDISDQIPSDVESYIFPSLRDANNLYGIALSCIDGATSLINHWNENKPDCVLVVADRTETLGIALAASVMQIPLIHLQGGEISGSIDDKIRDANTKLSDLHLTTNEFTKNRLIELGEDESRIFTVGCPSIDIIKQQINSKEDSFIQTKVNSSDLGGTGSIFSLHENFGMIMFHPDTLNESESLYWVEELVNLVKTSHINWLWFWPNPDYGSNLISKKIRSLRENSSIEGVRFVINLQPELFVSLASRSLIMVGNSSFGIREASYMGLRTLNLGNRQNGRQRSNNVIDIDLGTDVSKIFYEALETPKPFKSDLYGDGNAGAKAARTILAWSPSIKKRTS